MTKSKIWRVSSHSRYLGKLALNTQLNNNIDQTKNVPLNSFIFSRPLGGSLFQPSLLVSRKKKNSDAIESAWRAGSGREKGGGTALLLPRLRSSAPFSLPDPARHPARFRSRPHWLRAGTGYLGFALRYSKEWRPEVIALGFAERETGCFYSVGWSLQSEE